MAKNGISKDAGRPGPEVQSEDSWFWRMKREAQARDQELLASGEISSEEMWLLKPERLRGARLRWPDVSLIDDEEE